MCIPCVRTTHATSRERDEDRTLLVARWVRGCLDVGNYALRLVRTDLNCTPACDHFGIAHCTVV
eukprot:5675697-Prymnesium_polylepis.1